MTVSSVNEITSILISMSGYGGYGGRQRDGGRPPQNNNNPPPRDGPQRNQDYLARVTNATNSGVEAELQGFPNRRFWLNEYNMRLDGDARINPLDFANIGQHFTAWVYWNKNQNKFLLSLRGATQQPGSTFPNVPDGRGSVPPVPSTPHQPYTERRPNPPGNSGGVVLPPVSVSSKRVAIDYQAEPLPELLNPPKDKGTLKTNHFVIKHASDLKLWQYNIESIQLPKIIQDKDAKEKEDTKGKQVADPEDSESESGHELPILQDAKPNARVKRRLIFLLLAQLRSFEVTTLQATSNPPHVPTAMASNYIDKIVTAKKLIAPEASTKIAVVYYDEDHAGTVAQSRVYYVTLGQSVLIDVGGLRASLTGETQLAATPIHVLQTTHADVTTALNIIFSNFANQQSTRWSLPLSEYVHTRSLEPMVSAVGSQKFFSESSAPFSTGQDGQPPWPVPGEAYLTALPGLFRSTKAPFHSPFLLNVNTTTSAFYRWILLSDLVAAKFPGSRDWARVESFIRGLRVRTTYMVEHMGRVHERIFTVAGLPDTAGCYVKEKKDQKPLPWRKCAPYPSKVGFTPEQGEDGNPPIFVTIQTYFKDTVKLELKDVLDDVSVRLGKDRPLIPMSKLMVLPGQVWRSKTELVRNAQNKPQENARRIVEDSVAIFGWTTAGQIENFKRPFGLELERIADRPQLLSVNADLLAQPTILYGNNTKFERSSWNLAAYTRAIVPCTGSQTVPKGWTLVYVRRDNDAVEHPQNLNNFVSDMTEQLERFGMDHFQFRWVDNQHRDWRRQQINLNPNGLQSLEHQLHLGLQAMNLAQLAFTIILLPQKETELYALVKRTADMRLDINTVCCVRKTPRNSSDMKIQNDPSVLGNMKVKLNLKSSARSADRRLEATSRLLNNKTMLVGMDVTHAGPGSIPYAPSIAVMVASHDSDFQQFPASLRENARRQRGDDEDYEAYKLSQEEIQDLTAMLIERLECYQRHNDYKLPERIIFYRDGLSDSQMHMAATTELNKLKAAIAVVYAKRPDPTPKTMLICCVKRHHTRFYKDPGSQKELTDDDKLNGNIRPGVVVYEGVTDGKWQDFFLASQIAALGTCRPTHYVVLHSDFEDIDITDVAKATYQLCYLFGRCTKTVSLVPAAYYADKACDRARHYARDLYTNPTNRRDRWGTLQGDIFPNIQPGNTSRLRDIMFYL